MNIDIQVDDITNIIFNYARFLDFGFIYNPNYSKVFFTDNDMNYNSSKSAVTSPFITCNFNIDFRKVQAIFESNDNSKQKIYTEPNHREGHYSSTVIFKPFLSKSLNIDEANRVRNNYNDKSIVNQVHLVILDTNYNVV